METFLTQNAVAEMLGTSVRHLERLRQRGDGPRFVRIGARAVRYRESDVRAWIVARTATSRAEELTRLAAEAA
jgi:predicted DNA-binding transcriptional regulator AlpA